MKGLGLILCCVLALASANDKGNQQGDKRFLHGGVSGGFHGGVPGGVSGGFPGAFPGGSPGGFPGGHHGGFPGGHHGGISGGHHGGISGGHHGGFPGGHPGGFPGGHPGGFPGGHPGGFPGGHPGGFPSATAPPATCRRWCRTPERQAYCCETIFEPEAPVGTKPLDCPKVRPTCPPVRFHQQAPVTCSSDYKCGGIDKCCFDRCLKEHVCKPPSFYNQFG